MTRVQRSLVPIDRWHNRPGLSGGGADFARPMTLAPGMDNTLVRDPQTSADDLILRDRGPWYHSEAVTPPPVTWISWTAAGPARPELHVRNHSLRKMVGNSRSRYPFVRNSPTGGMHTMSPNTVDRTVRRYQSVPQQTPGRNNRLLPGQYHGQTYSQTTQIQGQRRR
jgi:hypothetical protein